MADTKITALTALTGADPANDVIPIVDVSDTTMAASGTTKKISVNNILGASGTATLASATITGDLTVDTSTLKVDSVNNRVGIGLTSPNRNLSIYGATNSLIHFTTASTGPLNTDGFTLGVETDSSVTLFNSENTPFNFYVNSTLGMTLNSTGLGVGVIPSGTTGNSKISIVGGVTYDGNFDIIGNFTSSATASAAKGVLLGYNNSTNNGIISAAYGGGTEGLTFWTHNGSSWGQRMELTATGNVGIGVTPSATMKLDVQGQSIRLNSGSATGFALLRLGGTASDSFFGFAGLANDIVTGTSAGDTVIGSNKAGANLRFISGNGVLNATLDASGNLLVGTVSPLSSVSGSSQIALGGAGLQTISQAISAATATTICRSGSGGMAVVGGYNGTGQYSAIIIFSYGAGGGVTVVSSQNNTGSTITYALSGVNVQVTSSLALTNLTTTCIRTA